MRFGAIAIDLEGTLHVNGCALPGASDALARLREWPGRLMFTSNNDSKSITTLLRSLRSMGLAIGAHELITPVTMLDDWLIRHRAKCHMLVSPELRATPRVKGSIANPADGTHDADAVIVGDCKDVGYRELDQAFRALAKGATLVALQRGRYFTRGDGPHLDTGALVAALEYASGVSAELLGKPAPGFFDAIVTKLAVAPEEVLVIGDDLTTDIAGAHAISAPSALVRTGKAAKVDLDQLCLKPDFVLQSVAELPDLLRSV